MGVPWVRLGSILLFQSILLSQNFEDSAIYSYSSLYSYELSPKFLPYTGIQHCMVIREVREGERLGGM